MRELARELTAFAAAIDYPDGELWPQIEPRLLRPRSRLRRLGPLAAAAMAAAAVAFAVTPARSAILRALGLEGVSIVRIERLPPLAPYRPADLGRPVTLREAQAAVPFRILLPEGRRPDRVFAGEDVPPAVSFVYGDLRAPRLLLTEFRPCCDQDAITKEVPRGVAVERVRVDGAPGLWIAGPHAIRRGGRARLAGPTLVWQARGIIFRLEASVSKREALRLADALAPLA